MDEGTGTRRAVVREPTDDVTSRSDAPARTIAYQPALDGVRALAVAAVLLFHAEVPGFGGGYLGVSVFFTLSGYLITSLLAAEVDRDGRVALGAFYARRARRLVPASLLVVMLVVIVAAVTDLFDGVESLRAHAIGSLLQVANWVFLAGDGSYQELLAQSSGTASPLEHYWSLAIEEQFYWIWPLAFVGLWRIGRTDRGRLRALAVVTVVSVVAAPVIAAVWGADAAYWSTPARAAEILLGALAALVLRGRPVDPRWRLLAPVALVILAVCVVTFPTVGGPAYAGALPAIGMVSVALIVGLQATSRIADAVSAAPLVWLGTISYGVYLFHWPIFVVVDEDRLGVGGPALLATRLVLTLVIAQVSFVAFERPLRHGLRLSTSASLIGAAAATGVAVVVAALVAPAPRGAYWEASADDVAAAAIVVDDEPLAAAPLETSPATAAPATTAPATTGPGEPAEPEAPTETAAPTTPPPTTEPPLVTPSRPVRMLVVGDSTAEALGAGVVGWAAENPELAQAEVRSLPGCGFLRDGEFLLGDEWSSFQPGCADYFFNQLPTQASELSADVIVLVTTSWDLLDRRWEPGGEPLTPSEYRDRLDEDFADLAQTMLGAGVSRVVWLEMPAPDPNWDDESGLQEDPDRHAVLHASMQASAEGRETNVRVLDFDGWFAGAGLATDRDARPDGIHFTPESAREIVDAWLGERLVRVALS